MYRSRSCQALLGILIGLNVIVGIQLALLPWFTPTGLGKSIGSLSSVLERVTPAVVTLRVTGQKSIPVEIKPRSQNEIVPIGAPEKEVFRTGGSGVIVDAKHGYILTNNHVVENATSINVGLSDGRRLAADLVGRDVGTDLALLKVEPSELPSVVIGDSDASHVGDVVLAIGNPFGLEGTVTMGIISAVMRTEIGHEAFEDYLQTDAQINSGNSGGALVNSRGHLIGINTVIAGGKQQGYSIGFAIPINMAMIIKDAIIKHGSMKRGFAGVAVKDLPHEALFAMSGAHFGAVVESVLANTSASYQGIRPGDIILQAANKPTRNAAEYMTRVSMVPVGAKLPLLVYSGGSKKLLTLIVSTIPMEPESRVLDKGNGSIGGISVGNILPGNSLYGAIRGALILDVPPNSSPHASGLVRGDVIIGIDGNKIISVEELLRRVEQTRLQYRLDIVREGIPAWVGMSK